MILGTFGLDVGAPPGVRYARLAARANRPLSMNSAQHLSNSLDGGFKSFDSTYDIRVWELINLEMVSDAAWTIRSMSTYAD